MIGIGINRFYLCTFTPVSLPEGVVKRVIVHWFRPSAPLRALYCGMIRGLGLSASPKNREAEVRLLQTQAFATSAIKLFLLLLLLIIPLPLKADVILPALISDNMVLQQHQQAHLWGWADPEERITLQLRREGAEARGTDQFVRTFTTHADSRGSWQFYLPQFPTGTYALNIRSVSPFGGGSDIKINNVAVGEVWLAAGQSNMAWPLVHAAGGADAIAQAKHPAIRFFQVKRNTALTPQDDVQGRWLVLTPETAGEVSAVAYHFARQLSQQHGVPLGIIEATWSGSKVASWTGLSVLKTLPALQSVLTEVERQLVLPADEVKLLPKPHYTEDNPDTPAVIYNAMIAPLHAYTLRGVIWYQGESDVHIARLYQDIFPLMIRQWRDGWQQTLPFLFVQLANFEFAAGSKRQKWAELRAAQTVVADSVAATGMVTAIDVGEADNIHPKSKAVVGERLARLALASVYGRDVAYRGPQYLAYRLEPAVSGSGQQVRITFDFARDLHAKGAITAFELADAQSGVYQRAEAVIDGAAIVLSAQGINQPGWLRYAWRDNPKANVYNAAGLPLKPFSLRLDHE